MERIIRIGKRNWVVGMQWSSYEDAPSKGDLKDDAERLGGTWTCVRIGEAAIQAGFCSPIDDMKKPSKLYSLAAMLADSREQPWLGVFKIEEGLWWYVAVRDGHAILPDGDVIGGEEEMYQAREKHSGYTDWKYFEGGIDVLTDFIGEVGKKPTPVRSLKGSSLLMPAVITGAGVVTALAVGGYFWMDNKAAEERTARQAAMVRMRAQLAGNQPLPSAASPLLTTPTPNDWLQACASALRPQPLSKYGWALEQVSCLGMAANVHWARSNGATIENKPDGVVSADGNAIDQSISLTGLNTTNTNDAIALANAKTAFKAWAQAASFNWTIADTPAAPPPLPGAPASPIAGSTGAPPRSPQVAITLNIPVSPFDMDFSSLPGLRFASLTMVETGWHLEGILYGK